MKTSILLLCASVLAATASATPFCTASQGVWCEEAVGDAPGSIQRAQPTMGTGSLNSILGIIGNGTAGTDVYSIIIGNTDSFSASLSAYAANGVSGETDADLYLFNSAGRGVEAAPEGTTLTGFNGPAGIYYIGVVPDGNDLEYKVTGTAFPMFNAFVNGQISLPMPDAGSLSAYTQTGCGMACQGGYDVSLTSAQYSNAPEPGSLAFLGSAMSALGLAYRLKKKDS